MKKITNLTLSLLLALSIAACTSVGPNAITREHFDYNQAIINTRSEQMLANLVRLKYRDPPYFVEVSSVATQYAIIGHASVAATEIGPNTGGGLGASATYEERPTITYTPLTGKDFVSRLLTPVDMETIVLLSNSGWRVDRLMRCCVQRVNNLYNARSASGPTPDFAPEYAKFMQMAQLFETVEDTKVGELKYLVDDGNKDGKIKRGELRLSIVFKQSSDVNDSIKDLKNMLDLDPELDEFLLTSNPTIEDSTTIAIQPRSVLAAMSFLSQAVEPPQRDIDKGFVTRTKTENQQDFDWSKVTTGLFRIRSSLEEPENTFVRVYYRDAWFYIADDDLTSKSTFNLLGQLFQLRAGEAGGRTPYLTLPIGG